MDSNTLALLISIIGIVLTLASLFGGYMAYRGGKASAARDLKDDAISALQVQVAALKDQVAQLVTENKRQIAIQNLIIETMSKKFGLIITIEKTSITILDQAARQQNVVLIDDP